MKFSQMKISYGHAGWVRVEIDDLPGDLFLRLEDDSRGRWRTKDFYLQGDWRHIVGQDLRELDLAGIEEIVLSEMDNLTSRSGVAGPDIRTLMDSFSSVFAGLYGGRHCESCDAPVRGNVPPRDGSERWANDWVALSWYAQYPDSKIKRPTPSKKSASQVVLGSRTVPRLQRPAGRLTDEFLSHVKDAYREALMHGENPAPALAAQVGDGATPRTIHKWVSVARQRGIMPPASMKGRPSHGQ